MAEATERQTLTATYQDYSPLEMISLTWRMLLDEWYERGPSKNFIGVFMEEFKEHYSLVGSDFYIIALVAVLFTLHRYLTTKFLLQPLGRWFEFKPKDFKKFPESTCKVLYYTAFAAVEYYLVNHQYPELRYTPGASWINYSRGMPVPGDIYWLYLIEAGFYFHGMYATIFMDMWRKDSIAMMFHHILANALIIFSLAVRYHRIGLLVLYLHDAADVCLETTKIFSCFNNKGKSKFWDRLCTFGFLTFTWIWFYFRLTVYPQIVLFSAGYIARTILPTASFFFFFNVMLWALFGLNLYWFHFIVMLIVRILTGRRIEDVREEDDKAVGEAGKPAGEAGKPADECQNGVVHAKVSTAYKKVLPKAAASEAGKERNPGNGSPRAKLPAAKDGALANNNGGYMQGHHKQENGTGCQDAAYMHGRAKTGGKSNDE